jgi:hypothetical protein
MYERRVRLWNELNLLTQGERYDLDQLSLEELGKMKALLHKRQRVGLEGLSEGELAGLERLLLAAVCLPPCRGALPC